MTDKPLTLTNAEHRAAVNALMNSNNTCSEDAVNAVVDAINRVRRDGDPLGTIRRSPKGHVAIRVRNINGKADEPLCWHYQSDSGPWSTTHSDSCLSAETIRRWERIWPRDEQ